MLSRGREGRSVEEEEELNKQTEPQRRRKSKLDLRNDRGQLEV